MQCFHYGESVAPVTEKVESPRNEILSLTLRHAGVAGSTVGTLCLRIGSHYGCTYFSVDLSHADQQERIGLYGHSQAWGIQNTSRLR